MRIHTLQEAYERALAELDAKPGYTVEQRSWGSTTVYTMSVDGVEVQRVTVNPKGATGTDTLLDCITSQYGLDKETWPQEMCDLLNQSRTATKYVSDKVEFLTLTGPRWGEARKRIENTKEQAGRKGEPTARTQIRGEVFKRLKTEHPEWSQAKVAVEATEDLGEQATVDTVRNTYRAMGWKWERADRIR